MKVYSIFNSISGEVGNVPQGTLTTFVRLAGCNLRCTFCDTPKTWTEEGAKDMSPEEIVAKVREIGAGHILVTGGEPMMQPDIKGLLNLLRAKKYSVSVETNGSIPIPPWVRYVNWIVDYKLPGSGMGHMMQPKIFARLPPTAWVKFVCASMSDLEEAVRVIAIMKGLGLRQFAVSPVLGKIDPVKMIEYLQTGKHFDIVFSLQIHKFIWPEGETEK